MPAPDRLQVDADVTLGPFRLEVALEIRAGETLALVGPNGAGKSTCIALIAGLLRARRALVTLGPDVWCDTARGIDRPPHERRVGLVRQDYALFPHLDVRENVAYGPRARGARGAAARSSADGWVARLGLGGLAHRSARDLSGGERQRVALARALAAGARVLLLDEPFGSLDVATRAIVRAELRGFLSEVRLPTLFVTHDATDALALGSRIAVLENGSLAQTGSREELLARPGTRFVADLFSLNHFRGTIAAGDGLREARVGPVIFHVLSAEPPGDVSLAFPPSAVTLSTDRPGGSAQNTFPARVREVLPQTDRVRVMLDCGVTVAADVAHEAETALHVVPGRWLWAAVKATAIQVYP
jgi:molybdate transport system ATP-binding protein